MVAQIDAEMSAHMNHYRDVNPSEFLTNVAQKDDVEMVLRREMILHELSNYTTHVPAMRVALSEATPASPLGVLSVERGDKISIRYARL